MPAPGSSSTARPRWTLVSVFMALSILLLLFTAIKPGQFDGLRVYAGQVYAPFIMALNAPRRVIGDLSVGIRNFVQLQRRNVMLEDELSDYAALKLHAETLAIENLALSEQLKVSEWPAQVVATGRILSHEGGAYLKSILVAAGRQSGIAVGDAVVFPEGLVGQVVALTPILARVLLINDFSSRIPVVVEEISAPAVLTGANTDIAGLDFLPIDVFPQVGARVSTSGAGGVFPAGIPVGVVALSADETDGFKVRPFADLSRIGFVSFVRPKAMMAPQPAQGELPTDMEPPAADGPRALEGTRP